MLAGLTRKLAIPVLLLSLVGWITYGVGFGLRNFRYRDQEGTTAASPDYIFLWVFLCSTPLAIALSFMQALWDSKIPMFIVHLLLPSFILSAGAVLFFDGIAIYSHHQSRSVNIVCGDKRISSTDIHGDLSYVPVEFAGAITSLLFYWVYLLMVPCFENKLHERY